MKGKTWLIVLVNFFTAGKEERNDFAALYWTYFYQCSHPDVWAWGKQLYAEARGCYTDADSNLQLHCLVWGIT